MDKKKLLEGIKEAKKSKPRKFTQTVELIVKIKGYDPKKEGDINLLIEVPKIHKPAKVCAIIGPELVDKSKKVSDKIITDKELEKIKTEDARKLAEEYDYFIAQAELMPKLAEKMGRVLGPAGKMPNPKRGQIVTPKSNIENIVNKLKNSVNFSSKKQPALKGIIGNEKMSDDELLQNIEVILDNIKKSIPSSQGAIDTIIIKTTMGKPIKIR